MGIPAMAFFCENGHLIEITSHHQMPNTNIGQTVCPECNSVNIRTVFEWGDPDYGDSDIVPLMPIKIEKKVLTVEIPIYDVSELFKEENVKMTAREALGRLLGWLVGFEDSQLYNDYKDAEGFTDDEWDSVMSILNNELMKGTNEMWHRWHSKL